MRLLDVATVQRGDDSWYGGQEVDSRACGVDINLADACDPADAGQLVGSQDVHPGTYKTMPFAISGVLLRPVNCLRDDDESWLKDVMKTVEETALGRALVAQPVVGTESWVGDGAAGSVPLAADADAAALAQAVADAREQWYANVVSTKFDGHPIMHVSPDMAPRLVDAHIINATACTDTPNCETNVCSIWGDPVVINAGYTIDPKIFFTGDIVIHLSSIETSGLMVASRVNRTRIDASEIAMIELDPCSIVTVGASVGHHKINVAAQTNSLSVTSTASGAAPGPVTWNWGDGTPDTVGTTTETHVYATAGIYTITATDSESSTDSEPVRTTEPPTLVNLTPDPVTAGVSNAMTLTGTGFTTDCLPVTTTIVGNPTANQPTNAVVVNDTTITLDWTPEAALAGGPAVRFQTACTGDYFIQSQVVAPPATLVDITPTQVSVGVDNPMTLTGTGFTAACLPLSIYISGLPAANAPTGAVVVNDTTITFNWTPAAGELGSTAQVYTSCTDTNSKAVQVVTPPSTVTLTGVAPEQITAGVSSALTLTGTGFTADCLPVSIAVRGTQAIHPPTNAVVVNDTTITVDWMPNLNEVAISGEVSIGLACTTDTNTQLVVAASVDPPQITSVSPSTVGTGTPVDFTLNGAFLTADCLPITILVGAGQTPPIDAPINVVLENPSAISFTWTPTSEEAGQPFTVGVACTTDTVSGTIGPF